MAMSLSNFLAASLLLLVQFIAVSADTITLDWNITWTTANPAGQEERPVIGINNQWPPPVLNVTKGDRIVAHVTNQLGNQSTSIHWHGFYQNGTNHMDGPQGVNQCGIPVNSTFTYNFTVEQSGSYWYHSHTPAQYPDGLRQALIIADPEMPYLGQYDEERVITLSDWYNDEMPGLMKTFVNVANPTGAEPVPNAALMNDTQNLTLAVEPGKTYLFHLVNVGAFAGQYFWIEGHQMKIVEVDGIYTETADADLIYLTTAQRYSVLVTMKNDTSSNFAMQASMDTDLFDSIPDGLNWNVTGWLVYDTDASLPVPAEVEGTFEPFDDFFLVPTDGLELYDTVDQTITLNLTMNNLGNGANYAFFNDITYVSPKVPTLYTVLTTGEDASNPVVYGTDTHPFVLEKDQVVEIVMNNEDSGKHPFHLHGHNFQAIVRSDDDAGSYDVNNHTAFPAVPMRRDTFMTRPNGNFVIRFKANNPGVWLFHCHIQWHMDTGLSISLIEAPLELQKSLVIPQDHFDACKVSNTPTSGNAAGNTEDFLDLRGQNKAIAPLPAGFTPRGIVALVFSCIAAFLGIAAISWYGAAPLGSQEIESVQRKVAEANVKTDE